MTELSQTSCGGAGTEQKMLGEGEAGRRVRRPQGMSRLGQGPGLQAPELQRFAFICIPLHMLTTQSRPGSPHAPPAARPAGGEAALAQRLPASDATLCRPLQVPPPRKGPWQGV